LSRLGFVTEKGNKKSRYKVIVEGKHWIISIGDKKIDSENLSETCRLLRMGEK
jgi:hypothetical protein